MLKRLFCRHHYKQYIGREWYCFGESHGYTHYKKYICSLCGKTIKKDTTLSEEIAFRKILEYKKKEDREKVAKEADEIYKKYKRFKR